MNVIVAESKVELSIKVAEETAQLFEKLDMADEWLEAEEDKVKLERLLYIVRKISMQYTQFKFSSSQQTLIDKYWR